MSLESAFKSLDNKDESNRALKELGQLHRLWREQDTYEFMKMSIDREIDMVINQTSLEQGSEQSALAFAFIKGLKMSINRMQWYEDSAEEVSRKEREDIKNKNDVKEENDKYVAGLEAGENCGTNQIVR